MKPVIGITTFNETAQNKAFNTVKYNYIQSIILAGGIPVLIPVVDQEEDIYRYVDVVDGLLFTGGEDISPLLYGENPMKQINLVSTSRDNLEVNLFNKAYEKKIPIMGICRGIQIINVALGGTLYQDIYSQVDNCLGHSPERCRGDELYHSVKIEKDSKLYDVFGAEDLYVNSTHHQAVKDIGRDLKITARSTEGIIEAVEITNIEHQFLMAVQWHPEDLVIKHPHFLKLFKTLIEASSKK